MTETYGALLESFRDLVADQVAGYRRLLDSTKAATGAVRTQDAESFERALAEQVETLRELKTLEHRRGELVRLVGGPDADPDLPGLERELRALALEVQRANRVNRWVIERNGAMVEARLGLHRLAGVVGGGARAGVDRVA